MSQMPRHPARIPCRHWTSSLRSAAGAACALAAAAAWCPAAMAQTPPPLQGWAPGSEIAVAADANEAPQAGARFGFAMAMNDSYAVIGAPDARLFSVDDDSTVNGAGAAYVFRRSGNSWSFVQRLVMPQIMLAQMGSAVAIDPSTSDIVVGAWAYNGRGLFSGAAFYFKKNSGDSWGVAESTGALGSRTRMPTQSIVPTDLQTIDEFGFSLAMANDTLVVGCPLSGSSNTGAVYVFEKSGETWAQTQKLSDEAGGSNDQLGTKVALDGNLLVCGIQNDDVTGKVNAGSVMVFKRSALGQPFALLTKLSRSSPVAGAQFGAAVAVRDGNGAEPDYIAVGAPTQASGASSSVAGNGIVYVLRSPDGTNWLDDAALLPRADNPNNNFGYALAMTRTDPPTLLVGAPGYDTILPGETDPLELRQVINAGAGFCFVRSAGGTWGFRGAGALSGDLWSPSITVQNSSIGRSVAIGASGGNFALVGSETPTGSDGTVYGFQYTLGDVGIEPGQVAGPAGGVIGAGGGGGGGGGAGSGGTGGGITGGGAPGTGSDFGGGFTIPLTPIVRDWGIIKGSAVAVNSKRISLLQTDGIHNGNKPQFRPLTALPEGGTFAGVGDMNNDNSGDILYVTPTNVLRYLKRDAFKILEDVAIDTLPAGYEVVKVADVNADNKDDIILQSVLDPRQVTVWYMSGGAISSSREYELPEGNWTIFTGAFTGSSNDIFIRDRAAGNFMLLQDDGENVTYVPLRDGGKNARLVGFGDLDSDGQSDIWWQADDTVVHLYEVNQDGAYQVRQRMRTSITGGRIIDVRDWDGDGVLDAWMRDGSRNFIIYLEWDDRPHIKKAKDLGDSPGRVIGIADR